MVCQFGHNSHSWVGQIGEHKPAQSLDSNQGLTSPPNPEIAGLDEQIHPICSESTDCHVISIKTQNALLITAHTVETTIEKKGGHGFCC